MTVLEPDQLEMNRDRWICCSEFRPLPGLRVAVLTADRTSLVAELREADGTRWVDENSASVPTPVTHWRPIPGGELDWLLALLGVLP